MSDEKFWNLMSRYASNELSLKETEELLEWLGDNPERAQLLKEFQDTWDRTKKYPQNFKVDTRAAWQKLRNAITAAEQKPKFINSYKFISLTVCFFLVLTFGVLTYQYLVTPKKIEVDTLASQQKEVVLPDGSRVWLNSNSVLSYADNFNNGNVGEVELKGEAFFEVAENPGKRFIIKTGSTLIHASRSSFNIKQDDKDNIEASVVTGKISFRSEENPKQELILLPGDAGFISREGYAWKFKYDNLNFLYWKNKKLAFANAPLSQVLKALEEAYQVKFQLKHSELLDEKITTSFNEASFEEVLEKLKALLGAAILKSDSVYIIEKK